MSHFGYQARCKRAGLERVAGIEPAPSAWKAEVLPLNYTRKLILHLYIADMVVGEGFEPSKLSQRIYSPSPLTARESHQRVFQD